MKKPGEFKSRKKHHKMVAENHAQIKLLKSGEADTVVVYATNGATSGKQEYDRKLDQKLFKCVVRLPKYIDEDGDYNHIQNGIWFSKGHRMFLIDSCKGGNVSLNFKIPIENCVAQIISLEEIKPDFWID